MNVNDLLRFIPNGLSIARIGLGLVFPFAPPEWRPWVMVIGAASDGLDGLAARWLRLTSDTGRLLDPIADKIFVFMIAGTLLVEGTISVPWSVGIAARDLMVLGGTAVVALRGNWSAFQHMRPSWLGKVTTAAQFAVLLAAVVWSHAPVWLLAVTTLLSIAAGVHYVVAFGRSGGQGNK